MIAVQTETLVGLIGFGGAVVGAGGALLGGWLQQHHAAKTAKDERRSERRYTTGQAALEILIRFRQATASRTEDQESEDAWNDVFIDLTVTFDAALYVVPDGDEMREQVFEIVRLIAYYEQLGQTHQESNLWIDSLCKEAIEVLSAFLREDPLPSPSRFFLDQQEMVEAHLRNRTSQP
ncbi:hypothetical protein R6V09_38365 [Streptomyces sp. W16]|uniref:hypothetical protein n=1 Tax=Streptomyces sp. W16 TaxID=3076631 RepID=UPI00295A614D|nr:hypothetical protein [Streptomyces sp. W16]MDV9175972.1 hypothetical protein [Streptomyces sp. W16]